MYISQKKLFKTKESVRDGKRICCVRHARKNTCISKYISAMIEHKQIGKN